MYRAPTPSWVDELPIDLAWHPPPGQTIDGVEWLLFDRQVHVDQGGAESYVRTARRITSAEGLQRTSDLALSWDPAYETLSVHTVRVLRDGASLDRLDPERFDVMRRETGLDLQLYDGSLSAVLVLDDLRVGDVLEVATTWQGDNPVFGGRFSGGFEAAWTVPMHHVRYRLIWPEDRPLTVVPLGEVPAPVAEPAAEGRAVRRWEWVDPPPVPVEDLLPAWFRRPWVQLTEYASWAEVADWAVELYRFPAPRGSPLADRIAEWAALGDDEARIAAVLAFVQGEVRYVGLEMGEGSHRPSAPDLVFDRRFGDCKDKATLMVAALRALGFRAWPALVDTDLGATLDRLAPSPNAFDHVIVAVELDGGLAWFDPTLAPQRGPPSRIQPPPFRRALLVREDTVGLTEIPAPSRPEPTVKVTERWTLTEAASARVVITTEYTGADADRVRGEMAGTSADALATAYLNYYARNYQGITATGPVHTADDTAANRLTTTESYEVPTVWVGQAGSPREEATVVAMNVRDVLRVPSVRQRRFPLAWAHPVHVAQTIELELAEGWTIQPDVLEVVRPEFEFRRSEQVRGNVLELAFTYRSLDEVVPPEAVAEHLATVEQVWDASAYSVVRRGRGPPTGVNWPVLATGGMAVALALAAGARVIGSRPSGPPLAPGAGPKGFGGWLLLLAFNVLVTPLLITWDLWGMREAWSLHVWAWHATPGTEGYVEGWAPIVLFELVANIAAIGMTTTVAWLMLARRRDFPRWAIATNLARFVLLVGDSVAAYLVIGSAADTTGCGQLLGLLLWSAYLQRSVRVRNTFVR